MNLYRLRIKHLAPKDSLEAIWGYLLADSDEEVYEDTLYLTYYDELDAQYYCEQNIGGFTMLDTTDFEEEDYMVYAKNHIISTKGEIDSDWADYDDLYYGKTHWGWELVKEDISESDVEVLQRLNLLL